VDWLSERVIFAWRVAAIAVLAVLLLVLALMPLTVLGQPIPRDAEQYRRDLVREARLIWGLTAPVATFAAQLEQESRFQADAVSPVGALGIAQFMPATASWLAGAYPALGPAEPRNPRWALRALARYDKFLWDQVDAADDCHRAAKMLSAYNGGSGWVTRDEALAAQKGLQRALWWRNVETVNAGRSVAAWTENRAYPRAILLLREARYIARGWGPGLCELK
jgi:soluble lytic murein transglycosylase-like protein